jgi:hypothetical protein
VPGLGRTGASLGGRAGPGAQRVGIAGWKYFGPAEEAARADLAARYPEAWARLGRRREFMADQLGIQLRPEVLPLSNLAGYLPPYWLAPGLAMRKR